MSKRLLLCLSIVAMLLTVCVSPLAAQGIRVPLTRTYVDPTDPLNPNHKSPVIAPTVYIDGYALTFETPCDGCTLQLVDENDVVVYSIIIPAGTTTLYLPSYLEGTFELQIIDGEWLFYGEIEL